MKRCLSFLLVALAASTVWGQRPGTPVKSYKPEEAAALVGTNAVIVGTVAQVVLREQVIYLNLERKFPDQPFSAVLFTPYTNRFHLNWTNLAGRRVEVEGQVEKFKDKPQIVVRKPAQLRVLSEPRQ